MSLPCGFYSDSLKRCTCAPAIVTKYQKRISGSLLDRIDIHIEVPRVDYEKLSGDRVGRPVKRFVPEFKLRAIFNKSVFQTMAHLTLSATPTCVSGRYGCFANYRMKVSI